MVDYVLQPHRPARSFPQRRPLVRIDRHRVGLRVVTVLQPVFELTQKTVRVRQLRPRGGPHRHDLPGLARRPARSGGGAALRMRGFVDNLGLAFSTLRGNPLRSLLTLLGIESGIGSDQLFGAWRTFFERSSVKKDR